MTKYEKRYTITFEDGEKITATAGMLNIISIFCSEAAENYRKEGVYALEKEAKKKGTEIYNYLDNKGYYND